MSASQTIRADRSIWDFLQPALDASCIMATLFGVKWAAHGGVDEMGVAMGLVAVVVFLLVSQLTGLRQRFGGEAADREIMVVVGTWTLTVLSLALLAVATRSNIFFSRTILAMWIVATPCTIAMVRMATRILQRGLLERGVGTRTVAVAGLNELGLQTARNIESDPGLGLRFVGFFDDRDRERLPEQVPEHAHIEGDIQTLVKRAQSGEVDSILVTLPMRAEERIRFILDQLSNSTVSVYIVPDFFVFELLHSRWTQVGGLPAVSVFENPLYGVDGLAKRCADIVLAMCALVVAAIPMTIVAIAVKWTSPGPVFFRQRRYGLDGREIRVWKFRSMRSCDDGAVVKQATKSDPRITPVGAFIRKTSLDELPQLFNVLEGSMSLVGPRPHASAHNEQYRGLIHGYMLRHKVKPGITGLAQVSGSRGETDTLDKMKQRIEFDHQYIRRWSLWLDIKILFKTLWVAWRQPEAY
ncbi:undecaprenyl-phosphate glucose phosphotransferase [Roseimaritima ulvae]|uniref:UDP-glucose:undecaprenyl-phosphate glucose-1-phosphate transferase n=1 Tax=Roseimaritima ulvae TaxID=980254 RepID=A0A5B9R7A4_9BACT|nr:undecaprenyl-phosphate glucose phosphotransferase [Roseimaritima ulvae]QEG42541.1 UDP-glucose:undecaprenyl-phosphate glucose-1-phosphate transferase [Roseimaritima ulvae]